MESDLIFLRETCTLRLTALCKHYSFSIVEWRIAASVSMFLDNKSFLRKKYK